MVQQPPLGQGLLIIEGSQSHSDTPNSVGLLWTSDQPVAVNSTWQHTTIARNEHPFPDGLRTHNLNKEAAADPHLRQRDHWDRGSFSLTTWINVIMFYSSDGLSLSTDRRRQMAVEEGLTRNHYCDLLIYSLAEFKLRKNSKKALTLRWLMSYIYGAPILDVSRSHTTTQHIR